MINLKSLAIAFTTAAALTTTACNTREVMPDAPVAKLAAQGLEAVDSNKPPATKPDDVPLMLDTAKCAQNPDDGWCKLAQGTREQLASPLTPKEARLHAELSQFNPGSFSDSTAYTIAPQSDPELLERIARGKKPYPKGWCGTIVVAKRDPAREHWSSNAQAVQARTEILAMREDEVRGDPAFFEEGQQFAHAHTYLMNQPGSAADGKHALVGCFETQVRAEWEEVHVSSLFRRINAVRANDYIATDNAIQERERVAALARTVAIMSVK